MTEDPTLSQWADLAKREERVGMRPGQFFLTLVGAPPDPDVAAFFGSSTFSRKAVGTQLSYTRDIKVFFDFLASRSKTWRQASNLDLEDYEYWRRRDPTNPRRVSGSKFNRELAALKLFFGFQLRRQRVATSPVLLEEVSRRDGTTVMVPELRSRNVQTARVKWLTPAAYQHWKRVGLGGYQPSGLLDSSWKGRNDGRNLAFADLLWSSGLRLREGATLLLTELPRAKSGKVYVRGRLSAAVTKNGYGREYWASTVAARQIDGYVMSTRQFAVDRARAEGRYEEFLGLRIVTKVLGNGKLRYRDRDGTVGEVSLDQVSAEERLRLFHETPDGLEPLALWLNDAGLPMSYASWHAVFTTANRRALNLGLGTEAGPLHCTPHMLRHSFALRMLVALHHVLDRRLDLSPAERKTFLYQFGDIWTLVAYLLGHKNPITTRTIYLQPVQGLQVEYFLGGELEDHDDITGLLSHIARESGLVHDIPDALPIDSDRDPS